MASVTLKNIFKSFGHKNPHSVVKDINLSVNDGEFLVLVGPSGCGKTTTLRMIAGLETVNSGEIFIGRKKVNDVHPAERDIAMVFQNYALYPHMVVFDNLAYGLKRRGVPKQEIRKLVLETANFLQMSELLNRKPSELSGGQRQRVALGRAIVRKPSLFLMDEPLSNLDTKLRVETRNEILRLHRELKVTTIYVTHDQSEAMTMGDRIVVMNAGEIQQQGSPLDLYIRPVNLFVATFLGTPAMNIVQGELRMTSAGLSFHSSIFSISLDLGIEDLAGRGITVGIRPQNLHALKTDVPPGDSDWKFLCKGTIEFVEHLGSQSFASVIIDGTYLFCEVNPEERFHPNEEVYLFCHRRTLHFFDSVSSVRVSSLDVEPFHFGATQ